MSTWRLQTALNLPSNVSQRSIHWQLAGCIPSRNSHLHGHGIVAVHHLPAHPHCWREGEAHQGRSQDHWLKRFGLLGCMVCHLRDLCDLLDTRVCRVALQPRSLSIYQLLPSIPSHLAL